MASRTEIGKGNYNPQQARVQSVEEIAQRYGLDPSDQGHLTFIEERRQEQWNQIQAHQERLRTQNEIQNLRSQITKVNEDRGNQQNLSKEEAETRAESRLNEMLTTGLKDDITRYYSRAVPKDRQHLLPKLERLTAASLADNPDYKAALTTATKWFRQSATAKDMQSRERWDQKGIDALAVVAALRKEALQAEANDLLGPIRRNVQRQNEKTQQLQGPS